MEIVGKQWSQGLARHSSSLLMPHPLMFWVWGLPAQGDHLIKSYPRAAHWGQDQALPRVPGHLLTLTLA